MQVEPRIFSFPDPTTAEGNRYAESLSDFLRYAVEHQRERQDTQDLSATLAVLAGTAAATALARGMAAWLARNRGVRLEIRRHEGTVMTLSHLDSSDVAQIAKALSSFSALESVRRQDDSCTGVLISGFRRSPEG
jgi:hypothetical protein